MSHLLPRHEVFCQDYVRGPDAGNCVASYEAAGFRPDRGNSSRLLHQPHIQKRIAELMGENSDMERQAAERRVVKKEEVVSELSKLGFANVTDYLDVDEDGGVQVDLTRLEHDQGAAIRNVAIDYFDAPNGQPKK